jgi:hypothetical protein
MNPFEAAARINELERENAALRADLLIEEERSIYWRDNEGKAMAENAALLLKIQDLELQNNAMRSTSRGKEVAKNKRLERENAVLRADKERLDWLDAAGYLRKNVNIDGVWKEWEISTDETELTLRSAIDAARKEQQP